MKLSLLPSPDGRLLCSSALTGAVSALPAVAGAAELVVELALLEEGKRTGEGSAWNVLSALDNADNCRESAPLLRASRGASAPSP